MQKLIEIDLEGNYITDLVIGVPVFYILTEVKAWTKDVFPANLTPPLRYIDFSQDANTLECSGGIWVGAENTEEDNSTYNIALQNELISKASETISILNDILELEMDDPEVIKPKLTLYKKYRIQLAALPTSPNWPKGPIDWPIAPE